MLKESALNVINPLNAELNHIYYLLALLVAHHILHVSRIRVKHRTLVFKDAVAILFDLFSKGR
jgi:hypothetical protein